MRVDEVMEFRRYWSDRRFRRKRPRYDKDVRVRCGDNIYESLPNGGFRQLRSMHSDGEHEHTKNKEHDLGGNNVLISETFAYYGSKGLTLPPELEWLIVGRGHRSRFSDEVKNQFLEFVGHSGSGIHAPPRHWPEDDKSWKSAACGSR
jgi:putative DNA base modification enzyme with NMAD domain